MYKCKYKIRWFYSKGAFLVLFWIFLSTTAITTSFRIFEILNRNKYNSHWLSAIPVIVCILMILPLGWLANTKIGVYNTAKLGIVLLLVTTFTTSFCTLFLDYKLIEDHKYYIYIFLVCINGSVFLIGTIAFIISIIQLGLDQMPDASSSNITSFIAWLVFVLFMSKWISDTLFKGIWFCLRNDTEQFPTFSIQLWSLIPVSCMSVTIVTDYLFAKKWLIIEPKSSQTLKTVYQVLKFAVKHKSPVNRSALTYWEENIPSRMDLAKLRYGGPFTTEQVEDVKISVRLFVLSLPLWVLSFSISYGPLTYLAPITTPIFQNMTFCSAYTLYSVTYRSEWWVLITTIVFEFVIYPIIRNRIPSILKRIGIIAFISFILSCLFLIMSLVHYFDENEQIITWVKSVLFYTSKGVETCFLFCAILELVCAQAPYNTRGFFTGYFIVVMLISFVLGSTFTDHPYKYCSHCNIHLILFGVKNCISLFGLVFYCLLGRWYKKRVRDEEYDIHRVVEEVYDRYLSREVGN